MTRAAPDSASITENTIALVAGCSTRYATAITENTVIAAKNAAGAITNGI